MYVSISSRDLRLQTSSSSFFFRLVTDRLQLVPQFHLTDAKSFSRFNKRVFYRTREKINPMRLPMVDCRSLIEFCKAFEQHQNSYQRNNAHLHSRAHHVSNKKQTNSLAHPFCEHSPLAAIDVVLLLLVLGALGFLTGPYLKFVAHEVLPIICYILVEAISNAPVWYVVGVIVAFTLVIVTIAVWEFLDMQSRKCGKPYCKGLRKAVEFDIQLESEECVKYLPPIPTTAYGMKPLELGEDHKELEAELKRMAPLNGRTVLIFRAPCGCPAGRLEVWGPKKIRRVKK